MSRSCGRSRWTSSSGICFTEQADRSWRPSDTVFQFVARDTSGWSPGFDVKDANGVEWSVKLGP